jgi:hexosaminidase
MKKLLKITLYFTGILILLALALAVFFFSRYNSLEKSLAQTEKKLRTPNEHITLMPGREAGTGMLNLLPQPKSVKFTGGIYKLGGTLSFSVADSLKELTAGFLADIKELSFKFVPAGGSISFRYDPSVPEQGYNMDISNGRISVGFSTKQGLFYSTVTLKVLCLNYNSAIPCVSIKDYPDLKVRGLMLDISRNKIPTPGTLQKIAGILSDLKYNHMELYVEGFSFAYPSFRELWEKTETPVTGEEIKALDSFCRAHFIDLVPNQNMFGHMMTWLATEKYKNLAECPKGYKMLGLIDMKGTLDPSDPGSISLVTRMADDLLPNFTSVNFNVNMDETFDLGKGKSKKLCKEKGEGSVYFDYAMKVHDTVTARHRKMMMWGDIVLKHPEVIGRFPKDVTLLDWGYESSYPFEKNAAMLQKSGVRFMVCPGTSSWSSFVGRTDNMIANIRNAVKAGVAHGAAGMLLTDWGDMGHWQYLPVSFAGYAYGGALSWNSSGDTTMPLESFLNSYFFRDEAGIMGAFALNVGKYHLYEEKPALSMTQTMMSFQTGLKDEVLVAAVYDKMIKGITELMNSVSPELVSGFMSEIENRHAFDFKGMYSLLDSADKMISLARPGGEEGSLMKDEYSNALRILRFGTDLQYYVRMKNELGIDQQKEILKRMKVTGDSYLTENKRLWMIRNKPGGYDTSVSIINGIMKDIDRRLHILDGSSFKRSLDRFFEKITTAFAATYIKNA